MGDAASNRELAAVAKALARMLQADAASRQALREEALKRFDGDYDVLYQPFTTAHAAFGQQLAAALAATDAQELTMSDVLTRFPNLNLSVPVHIDRWDAATYAPLVIFIPAGFSERTTRRVLAYDGNGQEHWLDAKKASDFPVVVVGPSERISVTQMQTLQTTPSSDPPLTNVNEELQPVEDGGGGTPPTMAPTALRARLAALISRRNI